MTLYLKYRPQDFESLVGQEFIKNTLREAINKEKLVGAYLFCGPRGTGKTSTARIFAKSINCLNPTNGNPCLECEVCLGFQDDSLVDIIEIDAASYTGVDNVREIIERAKFLPTKCKYKVYIIDEVHMLSKGAFNALLKILEEPPSHLKFILATTESHKIPETILSRCQRYDFKSITHDDLKNRLLYIAEKENIQIDSESLEFITKEANGGLRNAISLFEQLVSNSEIVFENVIKNYGIPESQKIKDFYNKLILKDQSIIGDFDYISQNYNLNLFFKEVLFFTKDKMLENLNSDIFKEIIFILETLEESFLKSKNSFDSKTTYLIGILKCLKGKEFFQEVTIPSQVLEKNIKISSTPIQKEDVKTKNVPVNNKELSNEDLFEVFGGDVFKENTTTKKEVPIFKNETSNVQENVGGNSSFPKDKFIDDLKKSGAKGALTMSLRSSDFYLSDSGLLIKTKTKISFNQLNDNDSIAKISQSLDSLGFGDLQMKIE